MARNVTATRWPDDHRRISLPAPVWEGAADFGTGVTVTAVYLSPRARPPRVVLRTYSVWVDGHWGITGTQYKLLEPGDGEDYARMLGLLDALDIEIPDALDTARDLDDAK